KEKGSKGKQKKKKKKEREKRKEKKKNKKKMYILKEEEGIRDIVRCSGVGEVYKRKVFSLCDIIL
ncbi:hypothetical protein, partial [Listeria monocytogenes]|uniref:hypothetical protein n=1 Tax=Listeria monocytogenes TaxID=1639 RepID=UPI00164F220A